MHVIRVSFPLPFLDSESALAQRPAHVQWRVAIETDQSPVDHMADRLVHSTPVGVGRHHSC